MSELNTVNLEFNSIIEQSVGLSYKDIVEKDYDEIQIAIERKLQKSLQLDRDGEINYRGNMLLSMNLIDIDIDSEYNSTFNI